MNGLVQQGQLDSGDIQNYNGPDYDYRGYWKKYVENSQSNGSGVNSPTHHMFNDEFKKPNHPTFSDQSIYNGINGQVGGVWKDGPNDTSIFIATPSNLQMHSANNLKNYFGRDEQGNTLILPQQTGLTAISNMDNDFYTQRIKALNNIKNNNY